jgi:hypothetical protein
MRIFLFLSALLATLVFIACNKTNDTEEKTGTLELVFKGRYDGAPLATFTAINTNQSNPTTLTFKKLEFFISQIQGKKDGNLVELADVDYVSLTNLSTTAAAEEGFKITIDDVPVGTYNQLQYGIGLPDAVNNKEPGDFESSSPLGVNGNYWASWDSYIFCRIEGDVVNAAGNTSGFLYHAGVNGMYQTRAFDKEFTVNENTNTTLTFHLHGQDLLFKAGQEIDVLDEASTHSGPAGSPEYALAKRAITNLADAIHIH